MNNMPTKKPRKSIKPGDTFQLGEHRLICGDSCNPEIVERLVDGRKISQINTDVPYGVSYVEAKAGFRQKISCEKIIANDQEQSEQDYQKFMVRWMKLAVPHLSPANSCYIFNSDRMIFALREAMIICGFKFAQLLIWIKSSAVIGRLDYLPQHELIAYGWHGKHGFLKAKDKSLIFCPKPQKSALHPTMKPISLIRRLILNNTKIGDWIYDPFAGSGTAIIAAEQTKRRCLAIELDPDHCQTIIDRYEKHFRVKPNNFD